MAFQMADDVKGTFWTKTDSGKAEAGDVRKRKKTLPLVWAHAACPVGARSPAPRRDLPRRRAAPPTDAARRPRPTAPVSDAEVADVLEILERCGAREHTLAESRRYRDRSLELLELLPCPPEGKQDLAHLVRSMIAA